MAADGAAAEVPTPAVFAQGGGTSQPGAGWVHVELHATSWKLEVQLLRVVVCWKQPHPGESRRAWGSTFRLFVFYFEEKNGVWVY